MRKVLVSTVLALSIAMSFVSPASAASLPDTHFRVKSVTLDARSGTILVRARVQCTGRGTMSWDSSVRQSGTRAHSSEDVPCDGLFRMQNIFLVPKSGRFHAGTAELVTGDIICGTDVCIGGATGRLVRLQPHRSSVG